MYCSEQESQQHCRRSGQCFSRQKTHQQVHKDWVTAAVADINIPRGGCLCRQVALQFSFTWATPWFPNSGTNIKAAAQERDAYFVAQGGIN